MSPEWIDYAIKLRENGLSYAKIAKEIKSSKETVSYYLKQKGYGPNEKYIYRFNHSQIKRLVLTGQNAYNILNKIYESSNIFLIRKFNKFQEFAPLFSNK